MSTNPFSYREDPPDNRPIPEQGEPVLPRGDVTAAEGPDARAQAETGEPHPYGPNNEQLPDDLRGTLQELVRQIAQESDIARRQEIRRVKQAHYFWRGLHYLWWNERDQNWHLPFEQKFTEQTSIEDMPRYEFVTNIYQAFGQSIVSVLSQSTPHVRFLPKSPSSELDLATSKAATDIADLVERNNNMEQRLAEEAFHLWVGGKVGAYVRYVVDGQAFGWHPEPKIEARQKQIRPARLVCPECGAETPEELVRRVARRDGLSSGAEAPDSTRAFVGAEAPTPGTNEEAGKISSTGPETPSGLLPPSLKGGAPAEPGFAMTIDGSQAAMPVPPAPQGLKPRRTGAAGGTAEAVPSDLLFCPECGALLETQQWLPPEMITVPEVTGTLNVPNGQEVVTMVGALELKTPPWASEQREYPYLQWNMETHLARLRAAYPHAADKIGPPVVPDGSQQYERLARLSQSQGGPFTQGGDINQNLITYQRTWMRPWAFYLVADKQKRERLIELFPEGCYVAFAGDAYLESRNESMDDHWRVMHALPGDGSSTGRPALGDSLISVQERFNTLTNLQMETYDFGVPPIYVDPEAIDVEATQYQTAEPGAVYPARPRPGMPLGASFFTPPPAQVPPDLVEHAQELMGPIAQFLTGAFPALFGGSMEGQKTASGYAMARDQAMGRLGLVWRRMRQFQADMMMLAVDCFRKNRSTDVEIPLMGAAADFESKWIRLADLKGNILSRPESDDQFPTLWNQKRGVLLQLMSMKDPSIEQTLAMPENLALVKQLLGLPNLQIPGEAARAKQMREIVLLLESQPVAQIDPATGQTIFLPSLVPDKFADNHQVELETAKHWLTSDAGQLAKVNNPEGWANVRAHAMLHEEFMKEQMAEQNAAGAAAKAGPVAKAQPEEPRPSESINFKDLPPEGQAQMAAQAGIHLPPQGGGKSD
ncbi:MAG TPA: hypothetical protein VNJ52_13450 [Patescibacteria group bacterium]|nr:hypothetical protein [Patescibacteria group bacterium]